MNVAVFADIHGRILLAFKVVERYQCETGIQIDLILQCGDVGIFPDVHRLDKATLRHAVEDDSELGFSQYFLHPNREADQVLSNLTCKMLCVRGNHEDHKYLDGLEAKSGRSAFPVDSYQRLYVLKSGVLHTEFNQGTSLSVVGIGRVGPPKNENEIRRDKYVQRYEQEQIRQLRDDRIDVLLTHDTRREFIQPGIGMTEIDDVLDRYQPAYHFFGHTGAPFSLHQDRNGMTVASKLSDFEWDETDPARPLKSGSFGLLQWNGPDDHQFIVEDPLWLKEYTMHTWRYL
ncbi:metallophosphoesterase family protein [Rubinisphaera brasiliensis]|uniref:Metallophosphoesterase n=1 Tax=Rubinisphaera brasiliensis (strain ATCC 49424 / DSM 5305 / JCM 21570 / IAM 15109 / NBRC 103401 / IFAM 1448) TaxID=756272 RepID=F0SR39_RUBBR|nr:metallophosphoesterase [Rubinisphaera brasiliensis]ADY61286.1 metallophosphoesterase [Rubinisphaera brasiliensis DSM 5305]